VAFSPNGKTAYVANFETDFVAVINVATGERIDVVGVGIGRIRWRSAPMEKRPTVANYA